MPTSGISRAALAHQPLHVVERDRRRPLRQRRVAGDDRRRRPFAATSPSQRRARGPVGDLGDLPPVVARVRDEVLEDHLLDVPVPRVHRGERLERGDALLLGLADADEDPARERDPQLAGGLDRRQPPGRMLGRRAGVHGLHQPLRHRLQHQPHRGVHLAQPREVVAVEHAEVRVRQHARARARARRPRST